MMQFKQAKWFALAASTTALAMTTLTAPAEAAGVKYNLQGVSLSYIQNGIPQTGSLTGSFFFDGATNTYSNIAINSSFSGGYLASSAPGSTASQLSLTKTIFGPLTFDLVLNFTSPLTGVLGNVALIDTNTSFEQVNGSFFGGSGSEIASFGGGAAVAVPSPALLPGLVGIGAATLRKRKAIASAEKA